MQEATRYVIEICIHTFQRKGLRASRARSHVYLGKVGELQAKPL